RDRQRVQRVCTVEIAGQRHLHLELALRAEAPEARAARIEGDVAGAQIGTRTPRRVADALPALAAGELIGQAPPVGVVDVEDREPALEFDQRRAAPTVGERTPRPE